MKYFIPILALLALVASGCYDNHNESSEEMFRGEDNCDLAQLRALCKDGPYNIEGEMVCQARVTSSDSEGNFYRSLVVEDESGAAEIRLGLYNSASQYPVGLLVALRLEGTAVIEESGVVQVGLPPRSHDESVREIASPAIIDQHILRSYSVEPTAPRLCDIASLDVAMCGRFVAIENLCYAPLPEPEGRAAEEYLRFVDQQGNTIFLYISPYANFADIAPASIVAVRGILYNEVMGMGNQFVIRTRFAEDISTHSYSF